MADISSGTPQAVALDLLEKVASVEQKDFFTGNNRAATREWILDAYAQCLEAALGLRATP